jgi:hypothetical protein
MHLDDFLGLLFGCFWPPPARRSPNAMTPRLENWAGWGLFVFNLLVAFLAGFAFLLPLFAKY